jgi:CheY-like chemotaxis protein
LYHDTADPHLQPETRERGEMAKVVLLVEDEPDAVDIGSTYLRHHDYEVVVAATAEEALDLARSRRPDVIVMDLMLPGIDGWDAIRRLKESGRTASIPVIVLSVRAAKDDRDESIAVGADSFIAKPAEPQRLLAEVRRLTGGEEAIPGDSPAG